MVLCETPVNIAQSKRRTLTGPLDHLTRREDDVNVLVQVLLSEYTIEEG